MSEPDVDLCLEMDFYSRDQLNAILVEIDRRNPGAKWTARRVCRAGEVVTETYLVNGHQVFAITEGVNFTDLRPEKSKTVVLKVRVRS